MIAVPDDLMRKGGQITFPPGARCVGFCGPAAFASLSAHTDTTQRFRVAGLGAPEMVGGIGLAGQRTGLGWIDGWDVGVAAKSRDWTLLDPR
jgi:hypothetical protein